MYNNQNYGCLMLAIEPKFGKNIVKFGKKMIPEKHLYLNKADDINGYESAPHITGKYGFTTDLTDNDIKQIISELTGFINEEMNDIIYVNSGDGGGRGRTLNGDESRVNTNSVTCEGNEDKIIKPKKKLLLGINGISCFECRDYDVVKLDILQNPILNKIHALAPRFPHIDTQEKYVPHITIAYIKKGLFPHTKTGLNIPVQISGFHYSGIDNSKRYYEI